MKKIIVVLALLSSFALVGCGEKSEKIEADDSVTGDVANIDDGNLNDVDDGNQEDVDNGNEEDVSDSDTDDTVTNAEDPLVSEINKLIEERKTKPFSGSGLTEDDIELLQKIVDKISAGEMTDDELESRGE